MQDQKFLMLISEHSYNVVASTVAQNGGQWFVYRTILSHSPLILAERRLEIVDALLMLIFKA